MTHSQSPLPPMTVAKWRAAIRKSELSPLTRLVLHTVADHLRLHTSTCSPPTATLAAQAGIAPRTVLAHLRRAQGAGLLQITPARRGSRQPARLQAQLPAPKRATPPRRTCLTLHPGDPRWSAWLAHDIRQTAVCERARLAQRNRWDYQVPADWPPESESVEEQIGLEIVLIPHGTPEHAAWLSYMRRTGRAVAAQSADVAGRNLREASRWPPLAPATPSPGDVLPASDTQPAQRGLHA